MAGVVASCLRREEKEKNEISQITEYLFLSGCSGLSTDRLQKMNVTAAVNCIKGVKHKFSKQIKYVYIALEDEEDENIEQHFTTVVEFIESERKNGGKTLVYCGLGISRSVTFVLAYLMIHQKMKLVDAYKFVQKRRSIICPNVGFFKQLINLEIQLYGSQTVRIIKPVEAIEVPDVVWEEVYEDVVKKLRQS